MLRCSPRGVEHFTRSSVHDTDRQTTGCPGQERVFTRSKVTLEQWSDKTNSRESSHLAISATIVRLSARYQKHNRSSTAAFMLTQTHTQTHDLRGDRTWRCFTRGRFIRRLPWRAQVPFLYTRRHLGAREYPFIALAYRRLSGGVINGGPCKVFTAARRTLLHVLERRHHFYDDAMTRSM
jgi:hypothetical protein